MFFARFCCLLCSLTLLAACHSEPQAAAAPSHASQAASSLAVQNGFAADFEPTYTAQCLKEQTSVNVDTKVYCLCMASFIVRDNQAADIMPLWDAKLSGNTDAAAWDALAEQAKKQRGCRIEKF